MRRYEVEVYHGTYSGTEIVYAEDDVDDSVAKAKARRQFVRKFGPELGMVADVQKIVSVEDVHE